MKFELLVKLLINIQISIERVFCIQHGKLISCDNNRIIFDSHWLNGPEKKEQFQKTKLKQFCDPLTKDGAAQSVQDQPEKRAFKIQFKLSP